MIDALAALAYEYRSHTGATTLPATGVYDQLTVGPDSPVRGLYYALHRLADDTGDPDRRRAVGEHIGRMTLILADLASRTTGASLPELARRVIADIRTTTGGAA